MASVAIERLLDGFNRFRAHYYEQYPDLLRQLATRGQSPRVAVVACCDSRTDPAILLDINPGDLFVIRNVANLVPPCEEVGQYHGTSAALEFAVRGLSVESIVVLGHAQCGGIQALMEGTPWQGEKAHFIDPWISLAAAARDQALAMAPGADPEGRLRTCIQRSVVGSLRNLLTFPWIRSRVEAKRLELHGWYFDLTTGELLGYRPESDTFGRLR